MIRLPEEFLDGPQFADLSPDAVVLYLGCLGYCRTHLTNGWIPDRVLKLKHRGSKKLATLIGELTDPIVSAPHLGSLFVRTEAGCRIRDFLKTNASREQVAELSAKRAEAGSLGGRPPKKQNASGGLTPLIHDPDPGSKIQIQDPDPDDAHERDGISIPEGSRDPYGIAPPGEDPDAYPGSVPSSPPVLTHPTPKPRRGAKPRPSRLDLEETQLTGDEAAIVTAIRSDPSLAPIVDRPCSLARDLKLAAPGCHVVQEVRRAGAWLRGNPAKAKSNGYRFLLGWLQRAQERGPRGPVVEEPPPRPPVRLPDHPPRPVPATLEELDALHRAEDAEALRRATPVGIDALPFVEDLADMPDDADGGEVFS